MTQPLIPHEQTHAIIDLNFHQLQTLAMLSRRHDCEFARINQQKKTKLVTVEFSYPTAYIIATNGRAITIGE